MRQYFKRLNLKENSWHVQNNQDLEDTSGEPTVSYDTVKSRCREFKRGLAKVSMQVERPQS